MKTVDWFDEGTLPGLLYFKNGSAHTGSVTDFVNKATKEFRYKIKPADGTIIAEVWYGPYCYEKSEIVSQSEFTLDSDGHTEMIGWIKEKYESMIE